MSFSIALSSIISATFGSWSTATEIVNFCTTVGHAFDVAGSLSLGWLVLGVIRTSLSLLMIPMMRLEKNTSLTK